MPSSTAHALARRSLPALVLSATLLLSACTGTSNTSATTTPSSSMPVSSSAPTTSATTAPAVSMPSYSPGQKLTRAQVVSLMKLTNQSLTTAHMEMQMKAGTKTKSIAVTMSVDADYSATPMAMTGSMTMPSFAGNTPIKIVLVDGNFYMNFGSLTQNKYMKVALSKLSGATGGSMLSDLDPTSAFMKYAAAFSGGTYVGSETVNGAPADHYTLSVNSAKLLKLDSSLLANAPKKVVKEFKNVKNRVFENVWIDSSGHLVKLKTSVAGTTTVVAMSGFGAPVTVTAPPADQVTTAPGF